MSVAFDGKRLSVVSLLPIALGVIAFFLIVGPRALNPANIAWLGGGDLATHYLGWLFYSRSDWSFPIGLNPDYGLELSNAIVFSDSNPLLAFVFKPFASLLPQPFQYFGIWLLICFVLQAWFAWKLIGLITPNAVLRALAAGLFVFAPPMLTRLGGHPNLAGHFFIIAALYFAFHPALPRRRTAWAVLLSASALVHAYLLLMVAAIWFANIATQRAQKKLVNRDVFAETAIVFAMVVLVCWQAGYFVVSSGASGGSYGYYRMNLISIVDPAYASYILKDIPEAPGDYEGYNFLGLGVLLLVVCALPKLLAGQSGFLSAARRFPVLFCVFAGLTLFALSNKIGVGPLNFEYPLPGKIVQIASYFRASGRMFWPVFYAIVFTVVFLVVRGNSYRVSVSLLVIALTVQIADSHIAWYNIRKTLMVAPRTDWQTPMVSAFWKEAATKYKKVRWVFPAGHSDKWMHIAAFAGAYGLTTDAVYLARLDMRKYERARKEATDAMGTGRYEPDALYLFDDKAFDIAVLHANTSSDLLFSVDGFNVLAPGWKQCAECSFRIPEVNLSDPSLPQKR